MTNKISKFLASVFILFLFSISLVCPADIAFTGQTPLLAGNVYYVAGTTTLGSGTVIMNVGSTLEVRAGGVLNTGSTLINSKGGIINILGTVNATTFDGRINISYDAGGTWGVMNVYTGGIVNISGVGFIGSDYAVINNYGGAINIGGAGWLSIGSGWAAIFNQTAGTTTINSTSSEALSTGKGPLDSTINISGGLVNIVSGTFKNGIVGAGTTNISGGELRVSGGTIENGSGGISGTINVGNYGNIFSYSGNIINGHASSTINVLSRGTIYNYYGNVNSNLGSLEIKTGGKFYNVRGGYPSHLTLNNGCTYIDSDKIYLTENISLDSSWTITSKAFINGQGHVMTFSNSGIIRIAKNASLLLRDVVIQNISSNQIRCLDNNSTLSLDKCTWLLDDNFSFTKGRIYITDDWNLLGNNHSFSYQSRKESSLAYEANFNLVDTTFIYDISISNTLFNPLSSTSSICLQNSTLQASQNWKPGAGTLVMAGNVVLNGIATLDLQNISNIKQHGSTTRLGTVLL